MPSQRTHTAQPRKHARKALPARFDIRNSAFGVSPRQYQVHAVKSIVDCIHQNGGNRYIWSTTGSGKTLTSFNASTLLKDNPDIEKCLFVVDRKDLDRQTRKAFNRFHLKEGIVLANDRMSSNQSGCGDFESAFSMKTSNLSQRATT